MSNSTDLSPQVQYFTDVLGVTTLIVEPGLQPTVEDLVESAEYVQKVLVWTEPQLSSSQEELLTKILAAASLAKYDHFKGAENELDWSKVKAQWCLCFGQLPKDPLISVQFLALSSLSEMLDPQTAAAAKKKTWQAIKSYKEEWACL